MPGGTPQPGPSAPLSSAPSYPDHYHPGWMRPGPVAARGATHCHSPRALGAPHGRVGRQRRAALRRPPRFRLHFHRSVPQPPPLLPTPSAKLCRYLLTGRGLAGFKYAHVDELHSFLRDALVQFGEAPTHPTAGDCQPGDCLPGAPNQYLVPGAHVTSRTDLSLWIPVSARG